MPRFVTRLIDDEIDWVVEATWRQRREIERIGAVDGGNVVDTTQMIEAIFPDLDTGRSPIVIGWDRTEPLTEETFWNIPAYHRFRLALLVSVWLSFGINQSDEADEQIPLPSSPLVMPTGSTPADTETTAAG